MTSLRHHTRSSVLATGLAALALFAAACSSTDQGSDDAADGSGGKGNDASVKFAKCMKEHGIEVPESKPGETVTIGEGQDPEKLQAAMTACNKGDSQAFEKPKGANLDAQIKYARCMRKEGINIADPKGTPGEPLGTPEMVNEPGFEKAHTKCNKILTDAMGLENQQ